jgi:hypothetical protein
MKKSEMQATIEAQAEEIEALNDKIAAMQAMIDNRDDLLIKYKRSECIGDGR